jgi:hypothetical protein
MIHPDSYGEQGISRWVSTVGAILPGPVQACAWKTMQTQPHGAIRGCLRVSPSPEAVVSLLSSANVSKMLRVFENRYMHFYEPIPTTHGYPSFGLNTD